MTEAVRAGVVIIADMLLQELQNMQYVKKRRARRMWVREWIKKRDRLGASSTFLTEVALEDPDTFKNHLRLTTAQFEELLIKIEPSIKKQDTLMRPSLHPRIKLQITLRYLATGNSFSTLEHMYRVPKSTISKFLPDVLKAIYVKLGDWITMPTCSKHWLAIAKGFEDRWNFPKCCGALDGKHINIECPHNSNSDFYNYKGFFSTILFALVDSNYCFTYIDIGTNGRVNDSTVFRNSSLREAIEDGSVEFPNWGVIVGDDAFPLKDYLMKPYSRHGSLSNAEKIFNYRLSRARRIVENAFGILAMRFRIFRTPISLNPDKVDEVVKAACAIHNWLRQTTPYSYMPPNTIDRENENGQIILGSWRNEGACTGLVDTVASLGSNNFPATAANRRKAYTDYFMGEGAVEWQWNMILQCNKYV